MTDTGWVKSSYSTAGNDNCVEVRLTGSGAGVRDSKNPAGHVLRLRPAAWVRFRTSLT
ncbi:DUF397 domain-containing protein [Actinosynnema sp. NPDC047251]|uniref:DUF397 domain-containing protein n=1 Tax=Saccharothrix espanaensis (strain ATCC 51144 / DSM 44229 / JCM 9112 / NBRC 15066 / NRRL 15764) TaxID=1179773 RepID=K0K8K8_SACES|nr:DUF397 domain-containing protein [Saccharothrix espanaensis]CCH34711.1 hypothetical protein BN6_74840 [Saccharothrix espanaensis DSM 44229]